MMKKLLLIALMVAAAMSVAAQVVWTEPELVQQSTEGIYVYFDASKGNAGLKGYTGDVYAHTGVTTAAGLWQHAPTWGDNSAKYKLEKVNGDVWRLAIGNLKSYYGLKDGEAVTQMCFVFRSGDKSKEGKDAGGKDIFVDVQPDGLAMTIASANGSMLTDATCNNTITVTTSQAADIKLYLGSVESSPVKTATGSKTLEWTNNFAVGNFTLIATATAGSTTVTEELMICHRPNSAEQKYSGTLLEGATKNADGSVTFCIYAPMKKNVMVVGEWSGLVPNADGVMNYDGDYFWTTVAASEFTGAEDYAYYYIVDDEINVADPYAKLIFDPWSDKYINQGYTRYPGLRDFPEKSGNFPLAVYSPNGDGYEWQDGSFKRPAKENLMVYEMLFRDFTSEQCVETAMAKIPYLKQLGINAVELMPFSEFDGNRSWGYNPTFYFAPDKYYGRPEMYKEFIDKCHAEGIAVIMDVVLNHVWGVHPWCKMYWDDALSRPASNSPFFNVQAPHNFSVGNDWKQENEHVQHYFCDMLKYWVSEYHIDGYRFDLVKGLGNSDSYAGNYDGDRYNASRIANMKRLADAVWSVAPDGYVIQEAFTSLQEEIELGNYGVMSWKNKNYSYRQSAMGYQSGSGFDDMLAANQGRPFASVVGYMESHDEERMAFSQKSNGATSIIKSNLREQCYRLGSNAAFALLVPGPKMIWQFGEMGYDISGGNGDTSEKAPHWEYLDNSNRAQLHNRYMELLNLRRIAPQLFDETASFTFKASEGDWSAGRTLEAKAADGKHIIAAFNPQTDSKTLTIKYSIPADMTYIASRSSENVTYDAAAGTFSVPAGCFIVVANFENESGVEAVKADTALDLNAPIFNVMGQQVAPGTKGLLIQNGQKFVVK